MVISVHLPIDLRINSPQGAAKPAGGVGVKVNTDAIQKISAKAAMTK
jgi:hypothetical protein